MKYLYLMGGSGCGKTRLAMNLEKFNPNVYKRILELSTRPMREGEKNMWDYQFVSDAEFDSLRDSCFEIVECQFAPYRYGALSEYLDDKKWNVIVASAEGFFSSVVNSGWTSDVKHVLVNIINDCPLDVERSGRDPKLEENFNKGCLKPFETWMGLEINDHHVCYRELYLSELKAIRNDRKKLLAKFDDLLKENN